MANFFKKALKIAKYFALALIGFLLLTTIGTAVLVLGSGDSDYKYSDDRPVINDITALNPVAVAREIAPTTLEEIVQAVTTSTGPISNGGGRYSQGGQTSYPDSLHIDMRQFNKVLGFDRAAKEITVQPGIFWHQLQEYIDPYDLSIRIMQTYSNFTVGGSLSVNAHGRYIGEGPLVHSVKAIKLVLADGSLKSASPQENSELFYGAIGGYGGIGVIVEVRLSLTDNIKVEQTSQRMPVSSYKDFFFTNVRGNDSVIFHNADIYPPDYQQSNVVSWIKTDKPLTNEERLTPLNDDYFWESRLAVFDADYKIGKWLRQHVVEPLYYRGHRVVWRNHEASYDVKSLEPKDRKETTYVLREYFVPVEHFDEFVPTMADIFRRHDANIINVSIRHAKADPGTLLAWARSEVFAFVVYYQQGTDRDSIESVRAWSQEMMDAVVAVGGSYYLPYQVFDTPEQFLAAYPRSPEYLALKKKVDPDYRFRNRLWQQHYPTDGITGAQEARLPRYYRGQEQTYLTIPEWYLVFNPLEYADFLGNHNNPSAFPFLGSIREYWKLYDRVNTIADGRYPANPGYMTMLRVIGISTTAEYMVKGLYENSIGRFTRWTASGEETQEDQLIAQAQKAYSDTIYDVAWYRFDFAHWVASMWRDTDFWGPHWLRKIERKLFFTLEFGFKTFYAKVIGFASAAKYEPSDGLVYLAASMPTDRQITLPPEATVKFEQGNARILAVPRWGGFTKIMPELARLGLHFQDIAGNSTIVASYLSHANNSDGVKHGKLLFASPLVSDGTTTRFYVDVPVTQLPEFLQDLATNGEKLEHFYDY